MTDGVEHVKQLAAQYREAHGMTLRALAERIGESEQWLSNKLNGTRKWQPSEVIALAEAIETPPAELLLSVWPELVVLVGAGLEGIEQAAAARAEIQELIRRVQALQGRHGFPATLPPGPSFAPPTSRPPLPQPSSTPRPRSGRSPA